MNGVVVKFYTLYAKVPCCSITTYSAERTVYNRLAHVQNKHYSLETSLISETRYPCLQELLRRHVMV